MSSQGAGAAMRLTDPYLTAVGLTGELAAIPTAAPDAPAAGWTGVERLRDALARRAAALRSGTGQYVAAIGVRTVARAGWGLALPAVLTVPAYGRYSVVAAVSVLVVQLATLGAPAVIVREAGRRVPLGGIAAHTLALVVAGVLGAALLTPSVGGAGFPVLAAGAGVGALYALLLARAKARFAFGTVLGAESAAAAGLVLAAAVAGWARWHGAALGGGGTGSALWALGAEAAAAGLAVAWYLASRATRVRASEAGVRGTRALLPGVYAVGGLSLLDVAVLRRVELYFLEHGPDGLRGVAVLGLALQLSAVLLLPGAALLDAWQPRLAVLFREAEANAAGAQAFGAELRRQVRGFGLVWGAAVLLSAVLPAAAIYGVFHKYQAACWTITAVVLVRGLCAGTGFLSSVLYAVGRQRWLALPCLGGAGVALGVNAWLTPTYGVRGAVVAHVATQVVVAGLTLVAFARAQREAPLLRVRGGAAAR